MARGPGKVRVASLGNARHRDLPAEGSLARLIVAEGKSAGTTVELGDATISIGRLASCELPIEEPQASRKHFEVVRRSSDTFLKDLGSRNGTYLNDERVEGEAKLEEGDRIRVGATVIHFEAAPAPLAPGTELGPFEITGVAERRKGLTVHEARHASLNRTVLVDVLEAGDPQAPRFLERARTSSAFDHPSLLAIYDAGEHEGRAYRVREVLVEARDLEARLREGKLDPEYAVKVAKQVAEGLAYIHAKGSVHGRLTPKVVLVDDRVVTKLEVVGDDNVERLDPGRRDARLQALSASPEEARGLEATAASDVYALGCVLFRMLAGVPPFDGDFPTIIRGHAGESTAPSITDVEPEIAGDLADLVATLTTKKSASRPTAEAVAHALADFVTGSSDENPAPPRAVARPRAEPKPAPPPLKPPTALRPAALLAEPEVDDDDTAKIDTDPADTDPADTDEVPPFQGRREIRRWREFDPVRAALLGLVFALLFFLSSEGTRLALRFLQK